MDKFERGRAIADTWNENWPIGTEVTLVVDDGKVEKTKTRSVAWVLGHGSVVVSLEGRAGGYYISRVTPIKKPE